MFVLSVLVTKVKLMNRCLICLVWLMDPRGETERRETAPPDLTRATKSQEGLTSHEVIGPPSCACGRENAENVFCS